MKEFEQAVTAAVQGMVASGKLNEIIEAKVARTVDDIVGEALRSYGDFGKSLKEALVDALAINTDDLGIAGYNTIVLEIVRRKLDAAVITAGKAQIEEDMDKLLSAATPGEIKLSQFLKDFAKDTLWMRDRGRRPTIILDESSGSYHCRWLYLDPKPEQHKHACAYRMLLGDDGIVSNAWIQGADASRTVFLGGFNRFDATVFRLYAAKARIVVDIEYPDDIDLGEDEDF